MVKKEYTEYKLVAIMNEQSHSKGLLPFYMPFDYEVYILFYLQNLWPYDKKPDIFSAFNYYL